MTDSLDRLFAAVQEARDRSPSASRTSKLFRDGVQKMAKKLAEEAIEVGLDAVQMNRESVILESADVLYHLAVIWAECGISPERRDGRNRPARARLRHRRETAQTGERGADAAHDAMGDAPQSALLSLKPFRQVRTPPFQSTTGFWPPSTDSVTPVTKPALGDARNRTASAISRGDAMRPIGIRATLRSRASSIGDLGEPSFGREPFGHAAVSVRPGLTPTTRTPLPA